MVNKPSSRRILPCADAHASIDCIDKCVDEKETPSSVSILCLFLDHKYVTHEQLLRKEVVRMFLAVAKRLVKPKFVKQMPNGQIKITSSKIANQIVVRNDKAL